MTELALLKLAEQAALGSPVRFRLGAVVAKRGRVLGVGFNSRKTHPLLKRHRYQEGAGLHAEMSACLGLRASEVTGARVYVVRLSRRGGWALARPCAQCARFLGSVGVKSAIYSTGIAQEAEEMTWTS